MIWEFAPFQPILDDMLQWIRKYAIIQSLKEANGF